MQLIDMDKAEVFEPAPGHEWVQRGPYIICKSCTLEHAVYIGTNKELTVEDGNMILRKVALDS